MSNTTARRAGSSMGGFEEITCHYCGARVLKRKAELKRRRKIGKVRFFCGLSCAAKWAAEHREDRRQEITKVCPECGAEFVTTAGKNEATFCSRGCASRGSVTPYRRARAREVGITNLSPSKERAASTLRLREMWKYRSVKAALTERNIVHQFEYPLPGTKYICDLALPELRILVEFDGPEHRIRRRVIEDKAREQAAKKQGWKTIRIAVPSSSAISSECVIEALRHALWEG